MRRNGKERRTVQPSLLERVRRAISTLVIPGNRGVSRLPFRTLSSYLSFFLVRPRVLSFHGRADSRLEKLNLPAIQQLSFQFKSHRGKEENGLLVFEIVSNIFPWFSSQSSRFIRHVLVRRRTNVLLRQRKSPQENTQNFRRSLSLVRP